MHSTLEVVPTSISRRRTGKFPAALFSAVNRLTALRPVLRPFGVRESESAMKFSSLGRLQCICVTPRVKRPGLERRQVCRECGYQVGERKQVDRVLTAQEIRGVVKSLQIAGIRSAQYELPSSVTTLRQLNLHLASESKPVRNCEAADQISANWQLD